MLLNRCTLDECMPTDLCPSEFLYVQEKVDELQVEVDSTKLDMEHAQLSAKENEAAARALRCCTMTRGGDFVCFQSGRPSALASMRVYKLAFSFSVARYTRDSSRKCAHPLCLPLRASLQRRGRRQRRWCGRENVGRAKRAA